jgi:hypothetical protein
MLTLLTTLATAAALVAPAPRTLVAGPVLAGPDMVVWGEQQDGLSVLRAWPAQRALWQSASSSFAGPLAASRAVVAFSRSFDPCAAQPGIACPVETETLAGLPGGSLRRVGSLQRCAVGEARPLAVLGSFVARIALDCDTNTARAEVRDAHAGFRLLVTRPAACCRIAAAGRFVAWSSGRAVDVFDLRARKLAYRATVPGADPIAAFDVQDDGTLALVLGPDPEGRLTLAWRSSGSATLHRFAFAVQLPASGPQVRLVGGRVVVERAASRSAQLVAAPLDGGPPRTLARFGGATEQVGGFDAAGGLVTWASRRIASSRVDCPPPGQGRPCVVLKTGTTTIWRADVSGGAAKPVAQWAFVDAP